ncbi:MAG: EamA family transporter [Eubacteriales bacterium]
MWVLLAFCSAFFAGVTAILAKCGIKNTDSNLATALRTIVVLIFSWLMVFIASVQDELLTVDFQTILFLVLSGISTGASWLCYFKALQIGDINKVTPIDKSSTVMTMILALFFLQEGITPIKCLAIVLIALGTFLMIQKKPSEKAIVKGNAWLFYALGSAFFASLTSILGKIGVENINSTLGTAIRTIVVLIMAWVVVFVTKKQSTIKSIDKNSWLFLVLSGIATGASWLCYYAALQTGPASIVVPIDKLSIVITVIFSYFVFKEKLSKKASFGLVTIVGGTLIMLL